MNARRVEGSEHRLNRTRAPSQYCAIAVSIAPVLRSSTDDADRCPLSPHKRRKTRMSPGLPIAIMADVRDMREAAMRLVACLTMCLMPILANAAHAQADLSEGVGKSIGESPGGRRERAR